MNNLREVKNDLLKDWIDYRAETIFAILSSEDKKHCIQYDEITERINKRVTLRVIPVDWIMIWFKIVNLDKFDKYLEKPYDKSVYVMRILETMINDWEQGEE